MCPKLSGLGYLVRISLLQNIIACQRPLAIFCFFYYMKLLNLEKQANYILIYIQKKKDKHQRALNIVSFNKYSSI